jgi:hypothetical protein
VLFLVVLDLACGYRIASFATLKDRCFPIGIPDNIARLVNNIKLELPETKCKDSVRVKTCWHIGIRQEGVTGYSRPT